MTVYNWGDYIDAELIDRFEKETGIKVIYETFDSNEAMMTKIEAAHQFINFMLDPEIAAQNAEYVSYSTPSKEALKYLPKEMVTDARFYPPPALTKKLEVYENLGKKNLAYYNQLFLEFKMHRK